MSRQATTAWMKRSPGKHTRRLLIVLVAIGLCFSAKRLWDDHAVSLYTADWSVSTAAAPVRESRDGFVLERFSFAGLEGEEVPVLAALPSEGAGPWPAVIFLYGIGMQMEVHDEVCRLVADNGFALFVAEQYNRGSRKQDLEKGWEELMAVRRRASLAVLETRRLVDLLERRPDIAPGRIYLWGGSFGAMVGSVVLAQEPRLRAGVLTLCGGNFPRLVANPDVRAKLDIDRGRALLLPLASSLYRPFDPIHYVDRIGPRPLLFQNASNDPIIPRECVEDIYDRARDPKTIRWYDATHEHVEKGIIEQALKDALAWLRARDREEMANHQAKRTTGE